MPHIHPTTSPKGGNKGSSSSAVQYLEKENENVPLLEQERFFNNEKDYILPESAEQIIDHNTKGLKKDDAKFFSVTYSFSKEELEGRSDQELKDFVRSNFTKDYAGAVSGREIDPNTIMYVAKLEQHRHYKGTDEEVKNGLKEQGQPKEGDNRHVHILVARKTSDNKSISPLTNHKTAGNGVVKSGFDRIGFKDQTEKSFDKHFKYDRPLEQSYAYLRADNKEELSQQQEQTKQAQLMQEQQQKQQAQEQERTRERGFGGR